MTIENTMRSWIILIFGAIIAVQTAVICRIKYQAETIVKTAYDLRSITKEAQAQTSDAQEMLRELIRENPGICITNFHWWAEHASTKESRESYRHWAEVFDKQAHTTRNP